VEGYTEHYVSDAFIYPLNTQHVNHSVTSLISYQISNSNILFFQTFHIILFFSKLSMYCRLIQYRLSSNFLYVVRKPLILKLFSLILFNHLQFYLTFVFVFQRHFIMQLKENFYACQIYIFILMNYFRKHMDFRSIPFFYN